MDIIAAVIAKSYSTLVEFIKVRPLFRSIAKDCSILEIGGGYNPRFKKCEFTNAFHLDHCDTATLRSKYSNDPSVRHLIDHIETIDFVCDGKPINSVIPEGRLFDLIFSSHALEHQVDLVGHLRSLALIMNKRGRIILMIPDLRACFDRFRFPTVTSDVLNVFIHGQKIHRGKQVFDAFAQGVNTNPGRTISVREMRKAAFSYSLTTAYQAMLDAEQDNAPYNDVHAWTFTPLSFRLLMIELFLLDLVCLKLTSIIGTFGNQFCVVLEHTDQDEISVLKEEYLRDRQELSAKLYRTIAG